MAEWYCTTDLIQEAHRVLAGPTWDYISGGAESETTLRRNRVALDSLAFRARIMRDMEHVDTGATLLGAKLKIPVILAPVGSLQLLAPPGGAASIAAARRFGTLSVLSSVSQPLLDTLEPGAGDGGWFQLYLRGDLDWCHERIGRIERAGFGALVLTADTTTYGRRERQILVGWLPPSKRGADLGAEYQARMDWTMLGEIRRMTSLPVVLKGIQTAEDALLAIEHGVSCLWISNHGGRQLDHARPTIDILREVAGAVGRAAPIIVDGGIMRGTDVLKAVALGADAVALGRLQAWALAADGEAGVHRLLEILEEEIAVSLQLLGASSPSALDPSYLAQASPLAAPACFPLLTGGIAF